MAGETREGECVICLKRETPKKQDLLCGDCVHDRIEIIRNSVVENDRLNNVLRNDINAVFKACELMQVLELTSDYYSRLRAEVETESASPDVIFNNVGGTDSKAPGVAAVKHLALQLRRLDIHNCKSKLNGIERTHESLNEKVSELQRRVADLQTQIVKKRELIAATQSQLTSTYADRSDTLDLEIFRLQGNGMKYIRKQSMAQLLRNYKVFKEIAFPNIDRWNSQQSSLRPSKGKCKLELFSQPVLQLSNFLAYNDKLEVINTFLENLIYLQVLLHELLCVNNITVELPYLDALKQLLPNSDFYDLVQKKVSMILDFTETSPTEKEDQTESNECVEEPPVHLNSEESAKITIRNNVIHIPSSSRTLNLQRRTSLRNPDLLLEDLEKVSSHNSNDEVHSKDTTSVKSKPKSSRSVLKGKNFVIVPHYILTKPFTKLLSDEYLKFILVIVKIVINFRVLLKQTIDTMPGGEVKRQSSRNSLLGTINQLRSHGGVLASVVLVAEEKDTESCDLEEILSKLADLDIYFKYLEQQQILLLDKERLSRSTSTVGMSSHFRSAQTSQYTELDGFSEIEVQKSQTAASANGNNSSKFRGLYNVFFRKNIPTNSQPPPPLDENIYGMLSEANLDSESKNINNIIDEHTTAGKSESTSNPQAIMKTVHHLIARGHGGFRTQGKVEDKSMKVATLSMMEESLHQLDDWDVLSRMY